MPCRKRKASRILLFPLAFAPTRTLNGPRCSVSSSKFLKLTNRIEAIMMPWSSVCVCVRRSYYEGLQYDPTRIQEWYALGIPLGPIRAASAATARITCPWRRYSCQLTRLPDRLFHECIWFGCTLKRAANSAIVPSPRIAARAVFALKSGGCGCVWVWNTSIGLARSEQGCNPVA